LSGASAARTTFPPGAAFDPLLAVPVLGRQRRNNTISTSLDGKFTDFTLKLGKTRGLDKLAQCRCWNNSPAELNPTPYPAGLTGFFDTI
jgi:hypothetical protein